MTQHRIMNAMLMGDEVAITLRYFPTEIQNDLHASHIIYNRYSRFSCGIIGFVGLITPHIARALVGTSHQKDDSYLGNPR